MVKDLKNGEILRADHLIEQVLETRLKANREACGQTVEQKDDDHRKKKRKQQGHVELVKLDDTLVQEYEQVLAKIDNYDGPELGELIEKYDIRNPTSGSRTTAPIEFNLMFQVPNIGPSSSLKGVRCILRITGPS